MAGTPRVDGVGRAIKAMRKMKSHDGRNLRKGIESCLNVIARRSDFLVPKDTLRLLRSRRIIIRDGVGLNVEGEVAYGGPDAPHAFVVHERPGVFHAPPTRSHYLAAAVNDTRGTCVSILRRQMTARDSSPADPGR